MPVPIPGPGGVVPHRYRIQVLNRYLYLPASVTDPGGGVLGKPADGLAGGAVLRFVVGRRYPGCSAAASDQDFGPLTTTSTNRTARSSVRSRPRGSPVSGSRPATQVS